MRFAAFISYSHAADARIAAAIQACAHLTRNLTKLEWRQFMGEVEYRATCNDLPLDARVR